MHYGTNPFLVGTPEEYIKAMGDTSIKIHNMKPGETLELCNAAPLEYRRCIWC